MNESLRCIGIYLLAIVVCILCGGLGLWLDGQTNTALYPTADEAAAEVRADLQAETKQARVAAKEPK